MSEPRIALVAEGPTDFVVIEAALKAILQRPFVLNPLQPEPTRPEMGGGWGCVFKWCQEFRQRGMANNILQQEIIEPKNPSSIRRLRRAQIFIGLREIDASPRRCVA